MPPKIAELIEQARARSGDRPFFARLDPEHPRHEPRYLPLVIRLARGPKAQPTAAERRAAKPRIALGQPQKRPPGCRTCP